jgi:uncharacterized protein (UPF0261 family)
VVKKGKTILILATMDTKGDEARHLKRVLSDLGATPVLMSLATRIRRGVSGIDIQAATVARAGGKRLRELNRSTNLDEAMGVMVAGAVKIVERLHRRRKIHAVIGIGGCSGTVMATAVMQQMPFGFPKVMVSSAAALPGLSNLFLGTSDILLFHSVVEISGRSTMLQNVLQRAAAAIYGMVWRKPAGIETAPHHTIAMTMLNTCEACARNVRIGMENRGYQVVGFHAAGVGDRAMEDMITGGVFMGVIDLAPGGVAEHHFGFMRDAGPKRLTSAGKTGIPQIVSTCGVNHITPAKSRYKPQYRKRRRYDLDRFRTWLRMTPSELKQAAVLFADRLNASQGPVKVLVPLRGWSAVDAPGKPTYDPEEDAIFTKVLKNKISKGIEVVEVDANIEEPRFAKAVIEAFKEIAE